MADIQIDLSKLNYKFIKKPLLVGGKAMEYYGLRKSGNDIDFIAYEEDVKNLIKMYPNRVKDLGADLGACPFEFEIWRTIHYLRYEHLLEDAIEMPQYLIASKKNLLFTKVLAMDKEKYLKDVQMIVQSRMTDEQNMFANERKIVDNILAEIENVQYIERA